MLGLWLRCLAAFAKKNVNLRTSKASPQAGSEASKPLQVGNGSLSMVTVSFKYFAAMYAAFVYAFAMLLFAGATIDRPYSPEIYHRLQAEALLSGHFYLSKSIGAMQFDTVFYNGQVQQIWGLGPGIWLALFELIGRWINIVPFPDCIPLGFAFVLMAYYSVSTAIQIEKITSKRILSFGFVPLLLLPLPLWTLVVKGPQSVYEDSSVYALIVSSCIFVCLVRIVILNRLSDFWICCILGGISGLTRPTHAIYGLLGVSISLLLLWVRRKPRLQLCSGTGVYVVGVIFLFWSNFIRFGSCLEFGHRLTQTADHAILTSRFLNPMERASVWAAANELLGSLFFGLGDIRTKGDFDPHMFPGQTSFFRWRNWYVTTYDPSLLLILLAGVFVAAFCMYRECNMSGSFRVFVKSPKSILLLTGTTWSFVSCATIFAFMLYYPGLCARYLYDFWPGFLGLLLIVWYFTVRMSPQLALAALFIWLGFQFWRSDCRFEKREYVSYNVVPNVLTTTAGVEQLLNGFNGQYDLDHSPEALRIPLFYSWWDPKTDLAEYVVQVPIDHPNFLELKVGKRLHDRKLPYHKDIYRARIDNMELKLCQMTNSFDSESFIIKFAVPSEISQKSAVMLFLCFVNVGDKADLESRRPLYYIRWR